jgi:hypothetical protein
VKEGRGRVKEGRGREGGEQREGGRLCVVEEDHLHLLLPLYLITCRVRTRTFIPCSRSQGRWAGKLALCLRATRDAERLDGLGSFGWVPRGTFGC